MQKVSRPFIISTILSLVFTIYYLILPSDPKTGILFGYSVLRLTCIVFLLVATGLFFFLGLKLSWLQMPVQWIKERMLKWANSWLLKSLLVLVLGIGIVFSNLPGYWFDQQAVLFERFKPLILWATLLTALFFGWVGIQKLWFTREKIRTWSVREKKTLWLGLGTFGGIALLALGIALSRLGLDGDIKYWNPAAIPLLGIQVFCVLLIAILIGSWLDLKLHGNDRIRRLDLLVGLAIWALAAVIWVSQPAQKSFFFPGMYPPNYQWYPISDSQVYDLSAINTIQGGFELSDKPAYIFLLSIFHLFYGFEYQNIIVLQQIILGLLPVFIYLIGLLLHSRRVGLFAALLVIFQTMNAIPGAILVPTTTVRQFMSENPTAWGLALSALLLLIWQREGKRSFSGWLVLAGAALGFTFYLRAATVLILPFLFFYLVKRSGKSINMLPIASLCIGFFLLVMPLAGRQMVELGHSPIVDKILFVINDRLIPNTSSTVVPIMTRTLTETPQILLVKTPVSKNTLKPNTTNQSALKTTVVPQETTSKDIDESYENPIWFIPKHFINNLIKSAFVLPVRLAFDDLSISVSGDVFLENGNWQGQITTEVGIFLLVNLALVSLGLGAGFRKRGYFTFIPMGMLLLYFLGTALSRTSGGRYLIPVLWVVLIYYAMGVMNLAEILWPVKDRKMYENTSTTRPIDKSWRGILPVLASIITAIVIGISLAFYSRWVPAAQPEKLSQSVLLKQVIAKDLLISMNLTNADVKRFLKQDGAVLVSGRIYYPNQLAFSTTIPQVQTKIASLEYPRLLFLLMNREKRLTVILPIEGKLAPILDDIDVLVLGCKFKIGSLIYIHAYSMVIDWQEDAPRTLVRPYATELTCPLRVPVCNNNRECH